jgi:hypothetical protein
MKLFDRLREMRVKMLEGRIPSIDLNLLAKLASGEGGTRTGALKRAGYLEWTVTPAGLEALAETKEPKK